MDDNKSASASSESVGLTGQVKKFMVGVCDFLFVMGGMIAFVVFLPVFKFGLYHYLAWKAYRENGFTVGSGVFLLGCLPVDIGILMCVWFLITGEWPGR